MKRSSLAALTLIAALFFSACSKEKFLELPNSNISIHGTIDERKAGVLSEQSRVLIIWNAPGDGEYIYGEGSINLEHGTFDIDITEHVPEEARMMNDFAMGFIFLTNNPDLDKGFYPAGLDRSQINGIAASHCVVFKIGSPSTVDAELKWPSEFSNGFSVGKGKEMPGSYDGFTPGDNQAVTLIIDDLDKLEFINW